MGGQADTQMVLFFSFQSWNKLPRPRDELPSPLVLDAISQSYSGVSQYYGDWAGCLGLLSCRDVPNYLNMECK